MMEEHAEPALGVNPSNLYSFVPSGWDTGGVQGATPASSGEFEPDDGGAAAEFTNPSDDALDKTPRDSQDVEYDEDGGKEAAGWILPEKAEGATEGGAEGGPGTPSSQRKPKAAFAITVGDYSKHGEDTFKGWVSYKINVKTTLAQYKKAEFSAERRFSDFYWLHDKLKESFKGFIIPPMPEKTIIQNRFDTQFVENRRRELGKFLKEVTEHPVLSSSQVLQTFLESPPEEWEKEKTTKPQTGVTKKMFSWVSSTVNQSLSPAVEVDEFFAKKDEYLSQLVTQLSEVLRISKLISQKQNDLMLLYYDFSVASNGVSNAEESNDALLAGHWGKLSDVGEQVRLVLQDAVVNQEIRFEEPIHNILRLVQAAKDTLGNRFTALAEFQAAEKRLAAYEEKKSKPGFKSTPTIEQQGEQLTKRVAETKEEYEMITSSVRSELERFEGLKKKELNKALRETAKSSMDTTVQMADQWKKMLNQIQSSWEQN